MASLLPTHLCLRSAVWLATRLDLCRSGRDQASGPASIGPRAPFFAQKLWQAKQPWRTRTPLTWSSWRSARLTPLRRRPLPSSTPSGAAGLAVEPSPPRSGARLPVLHLVWRGGQARPLGVVESERVAPSADGAAATATAAGRMYRERKRLRRRWMTTTMDFGTMTTTI